MTSGQDQDTGRNAEPNEVDRLVRDLKDVLRHGKDLNGAHCQKLMALLGLEAVMAASLALRAGTPSRTMQPGEAPTVVRRSIRLAIDRLARREDAPTSEEYAQVRRLLFGLTPHVAAWSRQRRQYAALRHYNGTVNYRGLDVGEDNFKRRICDKELLVPLAIAMLDWEDELQRDRTNGWRQLMKSGDWIAQAWEDRFWWLFRVSEHAGQMAFPLKVYFDLKRNLEKMRAADPAYPNTLAEDGDPCIRSALYSMAVLLRFARLEQPTITDGVTSGALTAAGTILQTLRNDLMLSARDIEWLDAALDRVAAPESTPRDQEMGFMDLLATDAVGRVVFGRFKLLEEICSCPLSKEANDPCLLHHLIARCLELSRLVAEEWGTLAFVHASPHQMPGVPRLGNDGK